MESRIEIRSLPSGATYVRIPHYCDEEKGDEWLEQIRISMLATPKEFRREILMDDTVHEGEPVFPEWDDKIHCVETICPGLELKFDPQGISWGGWDLGNTLSPAFALIHLNRFLQIQGMFEVVPSRPMPISIFCPHVARLIQKVKPGTLIHVGDQTGAARQGARGETAFQVAREFGFAIRPMTNNIQARQSAVSWALTNRIDEKTPRYIVSEANCPVLVAGFRGAYAIRIQTGQSIGLDAIYGEPIKNSYSHVQDANQYALMACKRHIDSLGKQELRSG